MSGLQPRDPELPVTPRSWTADDRKALIVWLLISLILPGIIVIALHFLFGFGGRESTLEVRNELPAKGIAAGFVVLGTWFASRLQHRSLDDYGIPIRLAFGSRFWEGCFWGFGMLSLLLLPLIVTRHFQIPFVALSGRTFFRYAFAWALVFLCVSVSEEMTFRGYLLFISSRRLRFWPAALALSVGFAAAHIANPGETLIGILQVFGTGLLFCFAIRRTGNLWFALGYHAAWDWAQTFFYGTPDSGLKSVGYFLSTSSQGPDWLTGGSAGPEGSFLSLGILVFAAFLIHLRFPNAIYPDCPA